MTKRKIQTEEEYETIAEMLYQLTDIMLWVGVTELKISKKEQEIFWDTEGGGLIDPEHLGRFASIIDRYWLKHQEDSEK